MRVGAIPHKTLITHCHVDAVPDVNKFSWTYNTSKGVLPVQGGKMQNVKGVSVLEFTPASMDIESLSCWASNDVGRQEVPCTFYIVPARKFFNKVLSSILYISTLRCIFTRIFFSIQIFTLSSNIIILLNNVKFL